MNTKALTLSPLVILALLAAPSEAAPLGPAFTYQGRLTDNGSPATGNYDLQFILRDAASGGNQVGATFVTAPVAVNNGLFTVTLNFGSSPFDGTAYWLETSVRTNGSSAAYTTLNLRHAITATPYAIQAANAGNLGGQPSTAFAPAVGSSAYVAKAGDTMTGNLNLPGTASLGFGATTRQMISLYDSPPYNFGIGVQTSTLYQRTVTTGGFAWYMGGVHNNEQNNSGGGTTLMTLDAFGDITVPGSVSAATIFGTVNGINAFSTGVSGENTGNGKGVYGSSSTVNGIGIYGVNTGGGKAGYFQGDLGVTGTESFGSTIRQMIDLYGATYGIGVQNSAEYFRTAGEFLWYKGGSHSPNIGDPANGTQLMRLGNSGTLIVSGKVQTPVLQITGGADVAEPFQMTGDQIEKGAVVIIDAEHPGKLKLSERAYDTRVAGIVSGANGVTPGISLSQQELNEGGLNVALSGRVYVLADASAGAIKPGDLLTTSDTPGHAMKVTDHTEAQGAILGKAMSPLKQGKGMVLVLVTLQ